MNAKYLLILGAACMPLPAAADVENGDDLHFEHCTGCHDSTIYSREERKVKSLAQLGTQVRLCRENLGLTWFDDEVDDVIEYLNQTYYRF